jgi:hypothetical protein
MGGMMSEMSDQLTLEECRKNLDAETAQVSDEELSSIRDNAHGLAGTLVDAYLDFRQSAEHIDGASSCPIDLVLNRLKAQWGSDPEDDYDYIDDLQESRKRNSGR